MRLKVWHFQCAVRELTIFNVGWIKYVRCEWSRLIARVWPGHIEGKIQFVLCLFSVRRKIFRNISDLYLLAGHKQNSLPASSMHIHAKHYMNKNAGSKCPVFCWGSPCFLDRALVHQLGGWPLTHCYTRRIYITKQRGQRGIQTTLKNVTC